MLYIPSQTLTSNSNLIKSINDTNSTPDQRNSFGTILNIRNNNINIARSKFLSGMLNNENNPAATTAVASSVIVKKMLTSNENVRLPKAIDAIVDEVKNLNIDSLDKIGAGSYGTCFRYGDFVIKYPVNSQGHSVDWSSDLHQNAQPNRVSLYLNQANEDPDFSRPGKGLFQGKVVDVLVSKFIKGEELAIEQDDNYFRASDLLESRGLYMYDINVTGNVLIDAKDNLYFIDGDQMVLSGNERKGRKLSDATIQLEDVINTSLDYKIYQAKKAGDKDDIEYYESLQQEYDRIQNPQTNLSIHNGSVKSLSD
ncbi:hypothetical protein AAGR22_16800 [Erwinia sp. HDF1-3R]|uniref:hypothetical protein n=1 Tax=Erwinia sp. HDF1-3R TaxID=3141543 RepID=UPI0031F4BF86